VLVRLTRNGDDTAGRRSFLYLHPEWPTGSIRGHFRVTEQREVVSFKYASPGTAAYQIELLASSVFELALKSEREVALSRDFYLTSLRDQGGRKATSGHVPASRSPTLRVRCSRDTYRINACSALRSKPVFWSPAPLNRRHLGR
jgi:hypothetical protein